MVICLAFFTFNFPTFLNMLELPRPVFPAEIEGYAFVEYLTTFAGMIFAFAVAEYFLAIGKLVKYISLKNLNPEYILWMVIFFFMFVSYWYIAWLRLHYIHNHLWSFFLLSLPALMFFLIASVFFPDFKGKDVSLVDYFEANIYRTFALFVIFLAINMLFDLFMPIDGSRASLLFQSCYLVFAGSYLLFKQKWIRRTVLCLMYFQMLMVLFTV